MTVTPLKLKKYLKIETKDHVRWDQVKSLEVWVLYAWQLSSYYKQKNVKE